MIDTATGDLILTEGACIGPTLSRQQFLLSPFGATARLSVKNEPWCSWQKSATNLRGETLYFIVYFHGSRLEMISLVVDPASSDEPLQDDRDEAARKAWHDTWLQRSFGKPAPYQFSWGSVTSSYDPRSDCSAITLTYTRPHHRSATSLLRLFHWPRLKG